MKLSKLFKRRSKYAPIAFLGRKKIEKILDADIEKLNKKPKGVEAKASESSDTL
jgi:hypothetical protein